MGTAEDGVGTIGHAAARDPRPVTQLLLKWGSGDEAALNELTPLVNEASL